MQGTIIKTTGSWHTVLGDDGVQAECKMKGTFRLHGLRTTNPVAVGDRVEYATMAGATLITRLLPRRNIIARRSVNLSKQSSVIAANVDQAMLIVTLRQPETSTTFIDRFLAAAEAYRVPVVIVVNKVDLLTAGDRQTLRLLQALYEQIGYHTVAIAAERGEGIDTLRTLLQGKTTLLSGNSGVGKTTILNALVPGANRRTAAVSEAHDTGTHTTTFAEMLPVAPGHSEQQNVAAVSDRRVSVADNHQNVAAMKAPLGLPTDRRASPKGECEKSVQSVQSVVPATWLIDSPGIRGFGTYDIEPHELGSYFREIFLASRDCRFGDCTHTHEPGCAVIRAVEEQRIALSRYQSYLSMLQDKDDDRYRAPY